MYRKTAETGLYMAEAEILLSGFPYLSVFCRKMLYSNSGHNIEAGCDAGYFQFISRYLKWIQWFLKLGKGFGIIMLRFEYAIFDLDGTLTESGPGIMKSVQYALHCYGIEEPDLEKLRSFVGPPLNISFREKYGADDETAAGMVVKFRERYNVTGVYENSPYPGIPKMLALCKRKGLRLAVASSKPEYLVIRVLEHFGMKDYFDVFIGSRPEMELSTEAAKDTKGYAVRMALEALADGRPVEEIRKKTAMVGDRLFDIKAAIDHGLYPVGVTFGYGSVEELSDAGALMLADSAESLGRFLTEEVQA